jgi:hypothetical protein
MSRLDPVCRSVPAYRRASLSGPTEAFVWPNRRSAFLLSLKGTHMKRMVVAVLIVVWWVPSGAFADERVGSAALGAVSGALVLGPLGAVAGAAVGYVAGPFYCSLVGTAPRTAASAWNCKVIKEKHVQARTSDPSEVHS